MKRFIQPQIKVINLQTSGSILAGSQENPENMQVGTILDFEYHTGSLIFD